MLTRVIKPVIRFMPQEATYALIRFLAALPQKPSVKNPAQEALSHARRLVFGPDNGKVAWSWGEGPLVILVHGWGSCGAHMGMLAQHIAERGFQAVAIDITAHGESSGKRISFRKFSRDLGTLVRFLNRDVYACVGHSAGGLGMMAARHLEGVRAKKYICIAAPRKPYPPINVIRKKLAVSEAVIGRYKNFLAEQFNCAWAEITERVYAIESDSQLLLVYDEKDKFVTHSDGDAIKACWSTAVLEKTRGVKHHQQIWDAGIRQQVADFISTG